MIILVEENQKQRVDVALFSQCGFAPLQYRLLISKQILDIRMFLEQVVSKYTNIFTVV